ncbi:MAG TPA: serine/threonine-protein kinase, partial [Gemmataceae bacterium]
KFRERFQREMLLMARFQHPYVVALFDASLSDPNGPCIIMEYIRGVNLDSLLTKNGRFTPARVGRLLSQLCEVLQVAHDQRIIHRDLKPANLMVVDAETPREKVKVMDFGLAKEIDPDTLKKVTDTNVDFAIGTPAYICPEQVRGEAMDHRGDLYAVGVILYELLTGRLPFPGPNPMDMLLAHATEPPLPFADVGAGEWVSPEVERVVLRCLEKDAGDRPQSARELAAEYDAALAAAGSALPPPAPLPIGDPEDRGPDKPFQQPTYITPPDDPNAILFTLDAWMPAAVALVKLRGYVHDANGQVLESVPGLIRVRLPAAASAAPTGRLSWLGFGRRSGPIILELHLQQHDERESLLNISVLFRPGDGTPATDARWRARCVAHFINLRGYMIGNTHALA